MNTQSLEAPVASKPTETRSTVPRARSSELHPPNTLERIALRVGITLILWSRDRAALRVSRDDLVRRYTATVARERSEREHERRWHLEGPRR